MAMLASNIPLLYTYDGQMQMTDHDHHLHITASITAAIARQGKGDDMQPLRKVHCIFANLMRPSMSTTWMPPCTSRMRKPSPLLSDVRRPIANRMKIRAMKGTHRKGLGARLANSCPHTGKGWGTRSKSSRRRSR